MEGVSLHRDLDSLAPSDGVSRCLQCWRDFAKNWNALFGNIKTVREFSPPMYSHHRKQYFLGHFFSTCVRFTLKVPVWYSLRHVSRALTCLRLSWDKYSKHFRALVVFETSRIEEMSMPHYPIVKHIRMGSRKPMPCPYTIDVYSGTTQQWVDISVWTFPLDLAWTFRV